MKKGTLEAAIKKGISFELTYCDAFQDHDIKRIMFSNCIHLINQVKGDNIVFNSGTDNSFLHRSPFDIASLFFFISFQSYYIRIKNSLSLKYCWKKSSFLNLKIQIQKKL